MGKRSNEFTRSYLMHKGISNEEKRKGIARRAANDATAEMYNRAAAEAQARAERDAAKRANSASKGHVSSGSSNQNSLDQYNRAYEAARADKERIDRRKADQERIAAANRQAAEGRAATASGSRTTAGPSAPKVDWSNPQSPSYKDWKKSYNAAYYQMNKEYWEERYKQAKGLQSSEAKGARGTAGSKYEGAARAAYEQSIAAGGEEMRRKAALEAANQAAQNWAYEQASVGKYGHTSKAKAVMAKANRENPGPGAYGIKEKLKDAGREIVSSGKNYIKNYADGAKTIKDLWKSGAPDVKNAAQSVVNTGRGYLNKLLGKS